MPTKNNDYLVNEAIRFPKVLVIDQDGNAQGVKEIVEELKRQKRTSYID